VTRRKSFPTIFAGVLLGLSDVPACLAQDLSRVAENLAGQWTGQLEYRDFSTDQRVFLPTWLEVSRAGDGTSLRFRYIYDDGPGKIVQETSILTLDGKQQTATLVSEGEGSDKTSEVFKAEGLEKLVSTGRGVFVLTGTGIENQRKVEVRMTVTCGRNSYRNERETRAPGEDFRLRHTYTFIRRQPPSMATVSQH